ncbi:MAG: hypothetical protein IJY10_05215 [Lachnospiraceae bacterium]|nr:hypothetical protein [Lachnospiraceae bacterium]
MDAFKKVLNVFGIIFGVIFSFALIGSLVVAPALSGANNFFKTENLKKMVNEIDFSVIVADTMGGMSDEDSEMMDILFEEGIMDEFLELYVEDLFAALDGDSATKKLTAESVQEIFENHMDVFVNMTKAQMDEETLQYVTDQEIEDIVRESLAEEAEGMAQSFPSLQDMGLDAETLNVIGMFRDGLVATVGIVLVSVFAVIVLICQFPRFKSFMWLGVDFILGGGLTLVLAMGFEVLLKAVMVEIEFGNEILDPMVEMFAGSMKTGAFIELGLAVVFIIIFVVGRMMLKKKANGLQMA